MFSFHSSLKHKAAILDYEPSVVFAFHSFLCFSGLKFLGTLMKHAIFHIFAVNFAVYVELMLRYETWPRTGWCKRKNFVLQDGKP